MLYISFLSIKRKYVLRNMIIFSLLRQAIQRAANVLRSAMRMSLSRAFSHSALKLSLPDYYSASKFILILTLYRWCVWCNGFRCRAETRGVKYYHQGEQIGTRFVQNDKKLLRWISDRPPQVTLHFRYEFNYTCGAWLCRGHDSFIKDSSV